MYLAVSHTLTWSVPSALPSLFMRLNTNLTLLAISEYINLPVRSVLRSSTGHQTIQVSKMERGLAETKANTKDMAGKSFLTPEGKWIEKYFFFL